MAAASTATSANTAPVARQAERRVSSRTTSFGSARRKSSLNSSPRATLLVEAADEHVLHFEEFLEAVLRALAAESGLLHAAERGDLRGDDAGVRTDDAGLHLLRHAEDAPDVAAVEIARESELRVVGKPDDLILGLEANQRRDGAERFLVGDDHVRRDVRDHGRLEEEAAALVAFAAQDDLRAFAERVGDVLLDLLYAVLVDKRPDHHAGLGAGADLEAADLLGELGGEGVVDAVLHVNAVRADAGLAGVAILRCQRAVHGSIQIGVVEHDERGVAAELERELLDGVGALAHEHAAGLGRAGERELAHDRTGAQLIAYCLRVAGEDIEHALRDAGALAELGQRERRVGRLPGGLDDHRAAGGERRPGLARDHGIREVPRRDQRAYTDRLLHDEDALVRLVRRNDVAVGALAFFGEPLDERGAVGDLAARFGKRFALLGSHDLRQVFLVRHHEIEPFAKARGALLSGLRAPGRPGALCGFDRALRLRRAHARHGAELLAGGRVVHGDGVARVGIEPFAVDVALLAQQLAVFEIEGGEGLGGSVHADLQKKNSTPRKMVTVTNFLRMAQGG